VRWLPLVLGLEFPALLALLDCANRPAHHFAGGQDDKRAWVKWLVVGVLGAWMLWGNGIVLGYYYAVVKRNSPANH
jgi:hypothetical protein